MASTKTVNELQDCFGILHDLSAKMSQYEEGMRNMNEQFDKMLENSTKAREGAQETLQRIQASPHSETASALISGVELELA